MKHQKNQSLSINRPDAGRFGIYASFSIAVSQIASHARTYEDYFFPSKAALKGDPFNGRQYGGIQDGGDCEVSTVIIGTTSHWRISE